METNIYDKHSRLSQTSITTATGDVIARYSYTYDAWGNILTISEESTIETDSGDNSVHRALTSTSMTYDSSNRMVTYNGEDIIYDDDGNMVYGPLDGVMTEFEYDCRNRLIRAGDTYYEYDAENIRTATETPEYREEYVTNSVGQLSSVLVIERTYKNETRTETEEYVYGNGLIYEESSEVGLLVYHFNHLGSTTAVTDGSGKLVYTYDYGTYGELITTTEYSDISPIIRFKYNGQLGVSTDDNGLYYMRSRYYNPEIKRFINQDILTGNIGNSNSLNRYSYVEGNPVSYTDPFGLSPFAKAEAFVNFVTNLNWKEVGHLALDLLGCLPGGWVFDMANVAFYMLERRPDEAVESLIFALPGMDLAGKAGKYAAKTGKTLDNVQDTLKGIELGSGFLATTLAAEDFGNTAAFMIDKYMVQGCDISKETGLEIAGLLISGFQVGHFSNFSVKGVDGLFTGDVVKGDVINDVTVKKDVAEDIKGNTVTISRQPGESGKLRMDLQLFAGKGGKGSVTYGELDSLGRTTGIEATITQDMIGTGSPAKSSIKPAGFGGQAQGHARGHLLGNQLGGSGSDPRNLVTIYQNPVNHPVMSSIEAKVRKAVEDGQIVNYKVTPIYEGNNLIPSGITIQAQGSGGLKIYQTILNRK